MFHFRNKVRRHNRQRAALNKQKEKQFLRAFNRVSCYFHKLSDILQHRRILCGQGVCKKFTNLTKFSINGDYALLFLIRSRILKRPFHTSFELACLQGIYKVLVKRLSGNTDPVFKYSDMGEPFRDTVPGQG